MNLSLYIARRYLFSRKKHNAINVISAVSMCGITLATLAMVCTLSVFNGFSDMVAGLFTAFDPELKITAREGKVFESTDQRIQSLKSLPEVAVFSGTLEESAMVEYKGRQVMAVIKGVEDNFDQLTAIDSILYGAGEFILHDPVVDYGIMGIELVQMLGTGVQFVDPLLVYAPKRHTRINMSNPYSSVNKEYLFSPGCVFVVSQQKYDSQYILTSLNFARTLFDYTSELSAVEIKLNAGYPVHRAKAKIAQLLGGDFRVQDRYEQQEDTFRIMAVEKLFSYAFLVFILLLACFNIIGSLSMLMLDKKEDVLILRNLGAGNKLISRIFLFEGWMISFFGALFGIVIGLMLCWVQQRFGLISLGSGGGFLVSAYPVSVHADDVVLVFFTVIVIGLLAVWYPVRYLRRLFL